MNINLKGGYFNFNFLTKSDWTKSSESMDNVQSVHGLSGHCPWTLSSPPGLPGQVQDVNGHCPDCPVHLDSLDKSRVSMDIVQTVH